MLPKEIIALSERETEVHHCIIDLRAQDIEDEEGITASLVARTLKLSGIKTTVKETRETMSALVKRGLIRRSEGEVTHCENNGYEPALAETDQVMVSPGTVVNIVVAEIEGHPQVGTVKYLGRERKVYIGFWGDCTAWKLAYGDDDPEFLHCYERTMPVEDDPELRSEIDDILDSMTS